MRFRFSLMTLVSLALLAGSGFTLWHGSLKWQRKYVHVAPWNVSSVSFSPKGNRLGIGDFGDRPGRFARVLDAESGSLLLDYDSEAEKALKFNLCGRYDLGTDVSRNEKMVQPIGWLNFSPNGDFVAITKFLAGAGSDTCVVVKRLDSQPMNNLFPPSLPNAPKFHRDGLGAHCETFEMATAHTGIYRFVNFKTGATFNLPTEAFSFRPDEHSFFTDDGRYMVGTFSDKSPWTAFSVSDGKQVEMSEHIDSQDRIVPLQNSSSFAAVDHGDPSHVRVFNAESGTKEFDIRGPAQAASAGINELYLKSNGESNDHNEVWRLGSPALVCRIAASLDLRNEKALGNDRRCYAHEPLTAFDTLTGRVVWQKSKFGLRCLDPRYAISGDINSNWDEVCDAQSGETISRFNPEDFPGGNANLGNLSFDGRLLATVKGSEVTVWESRFADDVGRQWLRMPGLWLSIVSTAMLLRSLITDRRKFAPTANK